MKDAANSSCRPKPAPVEPDLRPIEGQEADADLAEMARAIGHPARVRILRFVARRNTCICGEIVEEIGLAQSTVSQHLKILKEAGLIQGEIDGPRVCYCIDPRGLRRLKALVGGL
ncbi:MAG: winged helix-turn-helix transcriptional regulator [Planctomycetes bacterium]|nr:winged helix-turn-helix transcriptional regulator [Planctomycetota bacterium]